MLERVAVEGEAELAEDVVRGVGLGQRVRDDAADRRVGERLGDHASGPRRWPDRARGGPRRSRSRSRPCRPSPGGPLKPPQPTSSSAGGSPATKKHVPQRGSPGSAASARACPLERARERDPAGRDGVAQPRRERVVARDGRVEQRQVGADEPHRGGIRSAPSRRTTSPLSIGFSTMCAASAAYSPGWPSRAGCGTWAPSAARASSGSPASSGVSNRPGRDRADADPAAGEVARGRQRHPDHAALGRRVGELADLPVVGGDRRGHHDHAALAARVGLVAEHRGAPPRAAGGRSRAG